MSDMDKWQLYEELGRGGHARVFRARLRDGRHVAIKQLDPKRSTGEYLESFQREAQLAGKLAHPNIVALLGAETDSTGQVCLILELVEGVSLAELIRACHVPLAASVFIARSVLAALEHAHERAGVVHCDVSPHNVLISWDGEVKLSDFGISRAIHGPHQRDRVSGKLCYMSPEQCGGLPVDGRSDLFSVGILLYLLLSGGKSPLGTTEEDALSFMKENGTIPPLSQECPELPPALCAVVMKLLEHHPDGRYPCARAVLHDLPEWDKGQAQLVDLLRRLRIAGAFDRPDSPSAQESPRGGRFRYGLAVALVLLGVVGGALGSTAIRMLGDRASSAQPSTAPAPASAAERADAPATPEQPGDATGAQQRGSDEHSAGQPARSSELGRAKRSPRETQREGAYTIGAMPAPMPSNPSPWD